MHNRDFRTPTKLEAILNGWYEYPPKMSFKPTETLIVRQQQYYDKDLLSVYITVSSKGKWGSATITRKVQEIRYSGLHGFYLGKGWIPVL